MNLLNAITTGNLDRVRLFLEQGADKDQVDSGDNTLLYYAAMYNQLHVVQYLVEQGAQLNKASRISGITPLAETAYKGHVEIARYLLEQGADRDKADNNGFTPLHLAAAWDF